jgi:hypothetical protein
LSLFAVGSAAVDCAAVDCAAVDCAAFDIVGRGAEVVRVCASWEAVVLSPSPTQMKAVEPMALPVAKNRHLPTLPLLMEGSIIDGGAQSS